MFISLDLPLARRISLFPNLEYRGRPSLLNILGINRLSSNTILDSYTTILPCSNPYYRPIFLTKTFLSVLETYANIFSRLYTIRTCRYYICSIRSSYTLLPFVRYPLPRTKLPNNNSTYLFLYTLSNVLFYATYVLYYRLGSRGVLKVLALCFPLSCL